LNAISEKNKLPSDLQLRFAPPLYHKLLDYHVTEILMATLAIGAVVLFRLHR
jgi:hypothetical protein